MITMFFSLKIIKTGTPQHISSEGALKIGCGPFWAWSFKFSWCSLEVDKEVKASRTQVQ